MQARLLLRERYPLGDGRFAEIVIWQVPSVVAGSLHDYKYRLAFVVDDVCVLRFDNEAGKGDHLHIGERETEYFFTNPTRLVADFWEAIKAWRSK